MRSKLINIKFGIYLVAAFIVATISVSTISAIVDIRKLATLSIDTSIIKEDLVFNQVNQIVVVPIMLQESSRNITPREHFRGLFYYTVQKLGYTDIPFHYIVTDTGEIIEGNSGKEERSIKIEGIGDGVVVVAYLTTKQSTTFSRKSIQPLTNLLIDIVNKKNISPSEIFVSGVQFVRDTERRTVTMESVNAIGLWNTDLNSIKQNVQANFAPVQNSLRVQASIAPVVEEVKPGSFVEISINIANLQNSGIYAGTDTEIILSRTGANFSDFFINNEWISQTEVPVMQAGDRIAPLGTQVYTFRVQAPLYVGNRSETFELKTITGARVESEQITISLNMSQPDKQIVQILNRGGAGIVPVYAQAFSSIAFTQVSAGQRFFLIEEGEGGWVQIDLGNGQTGWVAIWNLQYI